ncbi:aldehyde dehydrogenase [Arthrobacter sunyaminii]|uniref:Aldehyde dehydrogenase n=1 Tax=Arthrobacter sunyaminii TaxID=2816859 RepID=A0A975XKX8_9MICC|nr:aldehyde dehydrogenase [Arthrobacter sunyaminii]MBO0909815.1 aldehyde dehydrogenase [Arthrobacter sunyaminii]QWQ36605.1 aldehyde dehydrogenase [Arthrobacter sunyaminii]
MTNSSVRDEPITLRHPDRLYINGEWTAPAVEGGFDVVDSTTEETFLRVARAGATDVDRAVAAARYAFDHTSWSFLEPAERAVYLRKMAASLRARSEELAAYWSRVAGMVNNIANFSVARVPALFDYYADLADSFEWAAVDTPEFAAFGAVVQEPVGVVGAIVPWNTPLSLAAYKIAPALLAGCTVVLKGPPEAPAEMYVLAEIAEEIGLPPGVLNVVIANREGSQALVADPRVDKIAFTGSSAVGRQIAAVCGERLARYTLELGGKSAAVILDDYDLTAAAKAIAQQECSMAGQVCMSLTRAIVTKDRHDEFAEALGSIFGAVRVGDPFDPGSAMGPLALSRQRDSVEAYIRKGVDEGGRLVTGGKRPEHLDRGWFVEPTVFANVDNKSTIAQEEIFGPVISVIPAENEEHAIELANGTAYGLNSAVFSDDVERAYRTARRLHSGTVGHNGFKTDTRMGYGGFKQSGVGREGGTQGLLPYLESKTVLLDSPPARFQK